MIWATTWDFQQCSMCDQQSLRSAFANAQSDPGICLSLYYSVSVKLLTKHLLEVLSLKGGCRGSSESALVKMPHCWKSHVTAHLWSFSDVNDFARWFFHSMKLDLPYIRSLEPLPMHDYIETFLRDNIWRVYCPMESDVVERLHDAEWELKYG